MANSFFHILYHSGIWLPPDLEREVINCGYCMGESWMYMERVFMSPQTIFFLKKNYIRALAEEGYTGLAALCAERKLRYYKIRPKEPCV